MGAHMLCSQIRVSLLIQTGGEISLFRPARVQSKRKMREFTGFIHQSKLCVILCELASNSDRQRLGSQLIHDLQSRRHAALIDIEIGKENAQGSVCRVTLQSRREQISRTHDLSLRRITLCEFGYRGEVITIQLQCSAKSMELVIIVASKSCSEISTISTLQRFRVAFAQSWRLEMMQPRNGGNRIAKIRIIVGHRSGSSSEECAQPFRRLSERSLDPGSQIDGLRAHN